jgi:tetratricopeptide (TPR) repeat protein
MLEVAALRVDLQGDSGAAYDYRIAAAEAFERAGDARMACGMRINAGYSLCRLGAHAEAEACLRDALATSIRLGVPAFTAGAQQNLGLALGHLGKLDEARALLHASVELTTAQGDVRMMCGAYSYLSRIHLIAGDTRAAIDAARRGANVTDTGSPQHPAALATLADALLATGDATDADEAFALAADAQAGFDASEGLVDEAAYVLRVYLDVLARFGMRAEVEAGRQAARAWLSDCAARISDVTRRTSFLCDDPDNARIMGE